MKVTRASVQEYVKDKGLELVQIDGIPEGFSFLKKNERKIGGFYDIGQYLVFIPLKSWEDDKAMCYVPAVVGINATDEEIQAEHNRAIERITKYYNENKNVR